MWDEDDVSERKNKGLMMLRRIDRRIFPSSLHPTPISLGPERARARVAAYLLLDRQIVSRETTSKISNTSWTTLGRTT